MKNQYENAELLQLLHAAIEERENAIRTLEEECQTLRRAAWILSDERLADLASKLEIP